MKRIISILILLLFIGTILFSGCYQTTQTTITNDKEAAKAISDISTDLSGIKNSLNEVDQTLTDQNMAK